MSYTTTDEFLRIFIDSDSDDLVVKDSNKGADSCFYTKVKATDETITLMGINTELDGMKLKQDLPTLDFPTSTFNYIIENILGMELLRSIETLENIDNMSQSELFEEYTRLIVEDERVSMPIIISLATLNGDIKAIAERTAEFLDLDYDSCLVFFVSITHFLEIKRRRDKGGEKTIYELLSGEIKTHSSKSLKKIQITTGSINNAVKSLSNELGSQQKVQGIGTLLTVESPTSLNIPKIDVSKIEATGWEIKGDFNNTDLFVISAIGSLLQEGEEYFTPDKIARIQKGTVTGTVTSKEREIIENSIEKCRTTELSINRQGEINKTKEEDRTTITDNILHLRKVENVIFQGRPVKVVYQIIDEPILYSFASKVKSLESIPVEYFKTSITSTTEVKDLQFILFGAIRHIKHRHMVLAENEKIEEENKHRKRKRQFKKVPRSNDEISLNYLYEQLQIPPITNRTKKKRFIEKVEGLLQEIVLRGHIKDYEVVRGSKNSVTGFLIIL